MFTFKHIQSRTEYQYHTESEKLAFFCDICLLNVFFRFSVTADGRKSKSIVRLDGEKLIHEQRSPETNELVTTIVREVVGDKFVQTLTAGGVKCIRTYSRKE